MPAPGVPSYQILVDALVVLLLVQLLVRWRSTFDRPLPRWVVLTLMAIVGVLCFGIGHALLQGRWPFGPG